MEIFYRFLEEEFEREVSIKTGWGKNEIMVAFHKAFARAVSRYAAHKGIIMLDGN